MFQGKYVIFESVQYGIEYPVLLPRINHFVNHGDLKVAAHGVGDEPVSAGFFSIDGTEVYVSGHSVSLKLKSRPEDAEIIKKFLTAS